jgi:hypothetical protein
VCGCLWVLSPSPPSIDSNDPEGIEIGPPLMTDRHIRILTAAARHSQRRLDAHDEVGGHTDAASVERRRDLDQHATRTQARAAAARARRWAG